MGEGEGAVAATGLAQRLVGILDVGNRRQCVPEALEALDEQRLDDAVLRVEVVVDAHGCDAGGGGNPTHGQRVRSFGLEYLGGGREQCVPDVRAGGPGPAPRGGPGVASGVGPAFAPGPAVFCHRL